MKKSKILVVDDDFSIRQIMQKYFLSLGCHVETASNGLEALEKFKQTNFDYLITDIEMPHMDGVKLIEKIRFDLKNSKLPIIVYSSNTEKLNDLKTKKLNIFHTIKKPVINFNKFIKLLKV